MEARHSELLLSFLFLFPLLFTHLVSFTFLLTFCFFLGGPSCSAAAKASLLVFHVKILFSRRDKSSRLLLHNSFHTRKRSHIELSFRVVTHYTRNLMLWVIKVESLRWHFKYYFMEMLQVNLYSLRLLQNVMTALEGRHIGIL